jgi:ABC-type thiamin/hydroxymethylpyrimidine transport system permease subunit
LRRMVALASEGLFSFSRIPLRLSTYLGAFAITIGLAHASWFLFSLIRGDSDLQTGATYLLVSTHLLSGALLCAVGILGEYIGRIFEQVKDRPLYFVKEKTPTEAIDLQRTSEAA